MRISQHRTLNALSLVRLQTISQTSNQSESRGKLGCSIASVRGFCYPNLVHINISGYFTQRYLAQNKAKLVCMGWYPDRNAYIFFVQSRMKDHNLRTDRPIRQFFVLWTSQYLINLYNHYKYTNVCPRPTDNAEGRAERTN